jgi:hypothetical protein
MGLTWGCAQCHSHKYDPLSHKEFYQLYAFFNQTEDSDKVDDWPVLKLAGASTPVMRELAAEKQRKTRIQERGNFLNAGAEVQAGTPEAFHKFPPDAPRNRHGLALWLAHPDNPLTARVQVNRFWARLFGRGLVESEEDFGTQGVAPTHPELLDWLATEFVRLNWDVKALLKTIVMSNTYRQSSAMSPPLHEKDPYNRLLARSARFRLDAEIVRDQALAASGLLSRKLGGPPVMPWQPEGIWQVIFNNEQWITSAGEDRYRRGLYTFMRRTSPYPSMTTYDAPAGDVCTMRRIRTNTPLQALASLNDPVSMEAAQNLALRALGEAGQSEAACAERMFRLTLARPPEKRELRRLLALHRQAAKELRSDGASPMKLLQYDKTLYTDNRKTTLVADARTTPPAWKYTEVNPGEGWAEPGFDDSGWKSGIGPFVAQGKKKEVDYKDLGVEIATPWSGDHLWLRIEFDLPIEKLENFRLEAQAWTMFEAFLNRAPAANSDLGHLGYHKYKVSAAAGATLKAGRNTLAIRVMRALDHDASQVFDVGLFATRALNFSSASAQDVSRAAWVVVANVLLNLDETLTRR